MPVISNLVYTVTATTIVATWNTDVSADSNLFAGAKPAVDNGVAANSTSHQCVVTDLNPNTVYSCFVTSGGTSSSPSNQTTSSLPSKRLALSATSGAVSSTANSPDGDTYRNFISNDGSMYSTQDDGNGFVIGSPNTGYNTQVGKITNESTFAGTLVSLSNYGPVNTLNGTDGPSGAAMGNKSTGIIGLNGNLHVFVYRQFPPAYNTWRYCNWIKSTDHGATWNNFTATSTFTANGNPVTPNSPAEPVQFYTNLLGLCTPVRYAADDGTLGYNTAGNQFDQGNAYIYCHFWKDNTGHFLLRIPRQQFDLQTTSAFEYWAGGTSPTARDFATSGNWSTNPASATDLTIAGMGASSGIWDVSFVPTINSYILTTIVAGSPGTIFKFYSGPTPAGPWNLFFTQNNTVVGSQYGTVFLDHRTLINNAATDNLQLRIIFSGEPGQANYNPNWATLTIRTVSVVANTFIQQNADSSGSSTQNRTLAYSSNVAVGDLLVVMFGHLSGAVVNTVDDDMGVGNGNWNIVYDTNDTGGWFTGWAWVFSKGAGPCNVTVHMSASVVSRMCVAEWNGPSTLRATAAGKVNNSLNPASNAITATAGDLILGFWGSGTTSTPIAAGAGYTLRSSSSSTASSNMTIEDALSGAGGSTTASFTDTSTNVSLTGIGAFFASTFTISGNAGASGATINYTGPTSGSTSTDGSGNYTIPNAVNGTYTITPSLSGTTFTPASKQVNVVSANVTGANFSTGAAFDILFRGRLYVTRVVSGQ